jgi:hypothetical protein
MRELLPLPGVQQREIPDAQVRHVTPFGIGDYSAYLDAVHRNTKRRLLGGVLTVSRPLRRAEQSGGKHGGGAQPQAGYEPGDTGPAGRRAAPGDSRAGSTWLSQRTSSNYL